QVRLFVPERHEACARQLRELGIELKAVAERDAQPEVAADVEGADPELLTAIGTAISIDADCLAVTNRLWLPYVEVTNSKLGFLLTDCSFLLPYSEIFARGNDVPWAFGYKSWYAPWNAFYQLAESHTMKPSVDALQK